jgi:ATP-binding cassette, subfamily B, bacterial MsbA
MALVNQEATMFDDSIRANIAYGAANATDENIMQASIAAHAHDFITALPEGYNTRVGELGSRLSGGQKQRIAIARAIFRNAPFLLLDEATSALDSVSEAAVREALAKLMHNRTCLIIAHRLSTIADCDNIYVLDKGIVAEQGNHKQLLDKQGIYYKMFVGQMGEVKS